jgi:hypothetical protein
LEKKQSQENKEFDLNRIKENLRKIAKPSCRHCYGEGYRGFNTTTGRLVVCRCAMKKIQPKWAEKVEQRLKEKANASKAGNKKEISQAGRSVS